MSRSCSRWYSYADRLARIGQHTLSNLRKQRFATMATSEGCYRSITNRVLMIQPLNFGCNPETACDNHFQNTGTGLQAKEAKEKATREFAGLVSALTAAGVQVNVEEDQEDVVVPDAVFPNNWISFDGDRRLLVLYPMMAEVRRKERRWELVQKWRKLLGAAVIDFSGYEEEDKFMEGTGSLVLDRSNNVAYACRSARTHPDVVHHFCQALSYKPVVFSASQRVGSDLKPIYHTNVMMSVGEDIAIVCLDTIRDKQEREMVRLSLEASGRTIVTITEEQVNSFLGNVLQLSTQVGNKLLVMSTCSYNSLDESQKQQIEASSTIVHAPVDTIETLGGGGVRCMIAEVFPPLHQH